MNTFNLTPEQQNKLSEIFETTSPQHLRSCMENTFTHALLSSELSVETPIMLHEMYTTKKKVSQILKVLQKSILPQN